MDGEPADPMGNMPADTPDPADAAMRVEERQALYQMLDRLPAPQAEAVRLKFLGELTFVEIAAGLDCTASTVKSRVRYGLAKLHKMMTADGDSGP